MNQHEVDHWFGAAWIAFSRCREKVIFDLERRQIEFSSFADRDVYDAAREDRG